MDSDESDGSGDSDIELEERPDGVIVVEMSDSEESRQSTDDTLSLDDVFFRHEDEELNESQINSVNGVQNFDPSLPTQHTYLGEQMEELSGRTVLDDDEFVSMVLISDMSEIGVVVIPGQTIPLTFFHPIMITEMKSIIQDNKTFGIRYSPEAIYGTTLEIFEYGGGDANESLSVKCKGRQRFKVVSSGRQLNGIEIGKLKMLPEIVLPDPLMSIHNLSISRYKVKPKATRLCGSGDSCKPTQSDAEYFVKKYPITAWPTWVYKQYSGEHLVERIMRELRKWKLVEQKVLVIPQDPLELSYWLAQSLPLDNTQRQTILSLNSSIQRLRYELCILERCKILCCKYCGRFTANYEEIFSMSLEGPQSAYVNPGGYVHETITLHKVNNLNVFVRRSVEHSWFPGYAWSIATCPECSNHMGWLFTATCPSLRPKKFWGIVRNSVVPSLNVEEGSFEPVI